MENKEKKYLKSKIEGVVYDLNAFTLVLNKVENKKVIGAIFSGDNENLKIMEYRTIYTTIVDLDWKIKMSFNTAIDIVYENQEFSFKQIGKTNELENYVYYYLENAVFRTITLWDLLAQLYNLYFELNIKKNKIYYKQIFSSTHLEKEENVLEIAKYLKQEDNTNCEGEWQGNHQFLNKLRNKMTHRNSPNITSISDYDVNFKIHPAFQLKRIVEDYAVVSKYLIEILNEIEFSII